MKGKLFFVADTHFSYAPILKRENRPFKDIQEHDEVLITNINSQVSRDDILYHLGDFCNYNQRDRESWHRALPLVRFIKCRVRLIIGNNEFRLIRDEFGGDFEAFREYAMFLGFDDVLPNCTLNLHDEQVFLTHRPTDHREGCFNLFGHTHRAGGLWRPFGINVGIDLNHFYAFSEDELRRLRSEKLKYWDTDKDMNCLF